MADVVYKHQWANTYWVKASIWMNAHWEVPFGFCVAYVIMLVALPKVMEHRKPFDLKNPLVAWNFLLAAFSIAGTYYTIPPAVYSLQRGGLSDYLCGEEDELVSPWVFFFCISKIPELIDTLFLILRKKPVIFLHWYHHIITLLYCWWGWASQSSSGGSFAVMNLAVHSVMYTYYGIMATGKRLPKSLAKPITTLQIIQMILGFSSCVYAARNCINYNNAQWSFNVAGCIMYISYALLFIQMFTEKYSDDSKADKSKKKDEAINGVKKDEAINGVKKDEAINGVKKVD